MELFDSICFSLLQSFISTQDTSTPKRHCYIPIWPTHQIRKKREVYDQTWLGPFKSYLICVPMVCTWIRAPTVASHLILSGTASCHRVNLTPKASILISPCADLVVNNFVQSKNLLGEVNNYQGTVSSQPWSNATSQ